MPIVNTIARWSFLGLLGCILIAVAPVAAQEQDTTRDPISLARRLLEFDEPYAFPLPTPLYEAGDETEFWVGKARTETPTKITATLASATPGVYVWVENGLPFNSGNMDMIAAQIDQMFTILRLRDVYGDPTILPNVGRVDDPSSLLTLPDVDNDPHLFVLYAADLGDDDVIHNFNDEMPVQIAPGGYSNQHELITINATLFPGTPPDSPAYLGAIARGIYEMLANNHTPSQSQWLKETLSLFMAVQLEVATVPQSNTDSFIQVPTTSLIRPARLNTSAPTQGGQQLFLQYLIQRFGVGLIQDIFMRPGQGMRPIDAALEANRVIDPLTGEITNAREVFADFVMANALNGNFGDGRYAHTVATLTEDQIPGGQLLQNQLEGTLGDQFVNQFGTYYVYVANSNAANFTVNFQGSSMTPRLAMPSADNPGNRFYWSGQSHNQDATMTRAFDLTGVESATLNFDVWYDLTNEWNYAYLEISNDGGETWKTLPTEASVSANRFGLAYGEGYTSISNPEGPRPFPVMGVVIDSDAMTITEVVADGPASQADLRVGDMIIGYDEQEWPGTPNVIALLANYEPGDTVDFLIRRGDEQFTVPVVLGAHPTRVIEPFPLWLPQEVDLSEYAGQEILVRFEYVSMPDQDNPGIALDNIAIPELNILDDAQGSDSPWTLEGWQHVDWLVPQRFLVQVASTGTQTRSPSVRHLIAPNDEAVSGEWSFSTDPNEVMVFAISGLNDDTDEPGLFSLTFSEGD